MSKKIPIHLKIIEWFRNHKPLDFRNFIIIFLLLISLKKDFIWFIMFLLGLITYPEKVDYASIFTKAGDKIGETYQIGMTKIYEAGLNLGAKLYPYNISIAKIIIYGIKVICIVLIIMFVINIINTIMYKKK